MLRPTMLVCCSIAAISCDSEVREVGAPLPQPGDTAVQITSPTDGSVLGGTRILVTGTVSNTWQTQVTLNGVPAPAEGGVFSAWVDVINGNNRIECVHSATGASHTIDIVVDKWPPVLELLSPSRGSFRDKSGMAEVSVRAFDEGGLSAVTVNGEVVQGSGDGLFTVSVPVSSGANTIRILAEDALGNVASEHVNVAVGPFGLAGEGLDDAVIVHLGPEALKSFESVLEGAADGLDYTALATALNPIVASRAITVNVVKVSLSPGTEIHLRTAEGAIELELTVRDLDVDITLGALGLSWDAKLFIPSTTVVVPITITEAAGTFDATLETPVFDFEQPALTLSDPDGSSPGTAALNGPVLESLETILTNTALAHGLGLLNTALGLLTEPYSRTIAGFELAVQLTAVGADAGTHGLELRLSGALSVEGEAAVEPALDPGPLRTPAFVELHPRGPHASIAISDDLINAAAHGIWRVGGLVRDVDKAVQNGLGSSALLAGFLVGLTDPDGLNLNPEAELTIQLNAPLPPVVGGVAGTDLVGVLLPDVSIRFETEGHPPVTGFLTAGFTGSALTEGAQLSLTLDTERTAFDLSVGDPDLARRVEAGFEPVMKHLLGELGPLFDQLFGSIPLPQLGPFQPVDLSVSTEGTGGEYIVVRGGLVTTP